MNKTFTFQKLPTSVAELQAMPQISLTDPFMTAALTVLVLCNYENNPQETLAMVDVLKGPQPLSVYEKQFIRDRLSGAGHVMRSYLAGTSPQNNYQPTMPYTITVFDNPYSYSEENYVKVYLRSSGADSERGVKLRKKGNQWFLWENFLMAGIRIPAAEDPWA